MSAALSAIIIIGAFVLPVEKKNKTIISIKVNQIKTSLLNILILFFIELKLLTNF